MVKNALEPAWEAKFEGTSYGFRPGRSCQDAIGKIYGLARPNKTKKWILDADIRGAFEHISHEYLLKTIGPIPGKELIKQWLKAGYMEHGIFHATEQGTQQRINTGRPEETQGHLDERKGNQRPGTPGKTQSDHPGVGELLSDGGC